MSTEKFQPAPRKVRNSFCYPLGHPDHKHGRREFFIYHTKPTEYLGFEIFCVIPTKWNGAGEKRRPIGGQYDIVRDDVCIGQVVTLAYAKKRVEEIVAEEAAV